MAKPEKPAAAYAAVADIPSAAPLLASFDVDGRVGALLELRRRVAHVEAQISARREEIVRLEAERAEHARNAAEAAMRLRAELAGADLLTLL